MSGGDRGIGGGDGGISGLDGNGACVDGGAVGADPDGIPNDGLLPAPWSTGFEDGFCGFNDGAGFCYADADSAYRLVESPVHSGAFAAAFEMRPSSTTGARQTRCVREGELPAEAYYGAWYYVPSDLSGADAWNLFYFQGGEPGRFLRGLWNVSMNDTPDGLTVFIFDGVNGRRYDQEAPAPIPLDRWFQLEFYLKRAPDLTGEVALYQDGQEVLRKVGIMTDDTAFAQWYVGNYAGALAPNTPTSSVYVDDVSVRLP